MSYILTIPALALPALSDSVIILQAYQHAKIFLLKVLQNELDHICHTPDSDHLHSTLQRDWSQEDY